MNGFSHSRPLAQRAAGWFVLCLLCLNVSAEELPIAPDDWFERVRGFEEAEEIQKELKADMLLFIASRSPAGPARRSRQFENEILRHRDMRDFLQHYVKVKLTIPTERDTNELAEERFRVQYGPRVFVVRPNGFAMPVGIHDRDGDRRTLLSIENIQRRISMASSRAYQLHYRPVTDEE